MGMKAACFILTLSPLYFTGVETPNPKNKVSYHHNNKDRNAGNASYIRVQRDAVRTVSVSAPHCSRPTNGFNNKVSVNKDPKLNLCPGEVLTWFTHVCGLHSYGVS